jgi:RimJ/RimL family protein N-acetyltransferase
VVGFDARIRAQGRAVTEHFELATRRGELQLDDGVVLLVRPLTVEDRDLLTEGFEHLSEQSRYHRFFSPLHELGDGLLVQLTDLDYRDRFAWIALTHDGDREVPVAVARYFRMADRDSSAELAVTVVDEYQGKGIGSLLVPLVAHTARANGFDRLEGMVLGENLPMLALLQRLGAHVATPSQGTIDFDVDLSGLPALGGAGNDAVITSLARSSDRLE